MPLYIACLYILLMDLKCFNLESGWFCVRLEQWTGVRFRLYRKHYLLLYCHCMLMSVEQHRNTWCVCYTCISDTRAVSMQVLSEYHPSHLHTQSYTPLYTILYTVVYLLTCSKQ